MRFKPVVWEYQNTYVEKLHGVTTHIFRQAYRPEYQFVEVGLVGVYDECSFPENSTPLENYYA